MGTAPPRKEGIAPTLDYSITVWCGPHRSARSVGLRRTTLRCWSTPVRRVCLVIGARPLWAPLQAAAAGLPAARTGREGQDGAGQSGTGRDDWRGTGRAGAPDETATYDKQPWERGPGVRDGRRPIPTATPNLAVQLSLTNTERKNSWTPT